MMRKMITTDEALRKAAFYLKMCCGFPEDAKCKLYKTQQTFMEPLNQHKVVFKLVIENPVNIPNNKVLAEKAVEPVWVYYDNEEKIDDRPFKILRDLIDILETNYEAMHIDRQAKKSMGHVRDKKR